MKRIISPHGCRRRKNSSCRTKRVLVPVGVLGGGSEKNIIIKRRPKQKKNNTKPGRMVHGKEENQDDPLTKEETPVGSDQVGWVRHRPIDRYM